LKTESTIGINRLNPPANPDEHRTCRAIVCGLRTITKSILKAELEIRHLHEELDHLLRRQYKAI
jgi:hypothetical protein